MTITEEDRDAVSKLQLFARSVVEGVTGGRHRSALKGSSIEFKEHREYVHGDAIRSIDWKLFGKTDKLFIRQYEDETNLRALLLLDQSGSMGYAGTRSGGVSKHQYAVRLAACLATLLIGQQDAVGLATLDTELRESIPPRANNSHVRAILDTLTRSKPGGDTSLGSSLRDAASTMKRRGMVFVLSDCFDEINHLSSALKFFKHQGHDTVLIQIWDPDELDFPFRNRTEFRSLENQSKRIADPQSLRRAYLKRVVEFRTSLEAEAKKLRVQSLFCTTDMPCADVIKELVAQRQRSNQSSGRTR